MITSKEESSPFRVSRPSGHSRKLSRVLLRRGRETAFAAELNASSRIVGHPETVQKRASRKLVLRCRQVFTDTWRGMQQLAARASDGPGFAVAADQLHCADPSIQV